MRRFSTTLLTAFALAACSHTPPSVAPELPALNRVEITASTPLFEGQDSAIHLGGLSDLYFSSAESNPTQWVFYSMTDRGPNAKEEGNKKNPRRPFLFPAFSPQILKIVYSPVTNKATLAQKISLTRPDGKPATGLPSSRANGAVTDEVAVDLQKNVLPIDSWGLDPEGLVQDDKGNFWISEEYGPSLFQVSAQGKILKRWSPRDPSHPLPAFLARRKLNRGFEALTWNADKNILLFLQSGIPSQKRNDLAAVVEFDLRTEKVVGLYFYPLSTEGGKIGGATLNAQNEILVLEQNGKPGDKAWQRVFKVDFTNAKNLSSEALKKGAAWQIPADAQALAKTEVLNISQYGLQKFEKLEGLSLSPEQDFVIVNDNDFGVNEENKGGSYLFFISKDRK